MISLTIFLILMFVAGMLYIAGIFFTTNEPHDMTEEYLGIIFICLGTIVGIVALLELIPLGV